MFSKYILPIFQYLWRTLHLGADMVRGLTTSAGVWMTAAIGIACGLGRESTALISTVLALIVLGLVPKLIDPKRDR